MDSLLQDVGGPTRATEQGCTLSLYNGGGGNEIVNQKNTKNKKKKSRVRTALNCETQLHSISRNCTVSYRIRGAFPNELPFRNNNELKRDIELTD